MQSLEPDQQATLAQCDYYIDVALWPLRSEMNPVQWLENFDRDELPYAFALLKNFLYFSDRLVNSMFAAALQSISQHLNLGQIRYDAMQLRWKTFTEQLILTYVTGEVPNPSDSGYAFARKGRTVIGLQESQIMTPKDAMRELFYRDARPIVFVDDFVGSGHQFAKMWQRTWEILDSKSSTFEEFSRSRSTQFYYCPVLCTERGRDMIKSIAPKVILSPAHILPNKYSALASDSLIWPENLRSTAVAFLQTASGRAGYTKNSWKGYDELALAVAFEHSVPNATLPIFYSQRNGWKPLIRRT